VESLLLTCLHLPLPEQNIMIKGLRTLIVFDNGY
jgi:hypothetical protein